MYRRLEWRIDAGLPQQNDMLAEVTDLVQQAMPHLGAILPEGPDPDWNDPACEQYHQVAVAVVWALGCVERCSRVDRSGRGLFICHGISAMPQVRILMMQYSV